ncbi:MAG TPA: cell division protein FtsX [Thiothrix sp.]|nr:cell division protein FtsX [Thiothrix sp.]
MARRPRARKRNAPRAKKRRNRSPHYSPFSTWWNQVNAAISFSLRRLWYNPISTWITLAAIAIALSLPAALHLMVKNMQTLTDDNQQIPTISVFLKQHISTDQAKDRGELISELSEVVTVLFVSKENALNKFKRLSGFAETLETLEENPLPHALVVTPNLRIMNDTKLTNLIRTLKSYPEVDAVQSDNEWMQRLRAIMDIAERVILVVSVLLALTVLLVVGNTIRLDIENRKEEIDVARFIGATRSYIRQPFIFGGLWYGFFGGILSLVIVHFSIFFLIAPTNRLSTLYGTQFNISGLDFSTSFYILIASGLLGIVGAWIAVTSHLRRREITF